MGNRESKLKVAKEGSRAAGGDGVAGVAAGGANKGPKQAPLGEWESPITSAFITEKAVRLGSVAVRDSDGAIFWLEGRPEEGGRQVLVMRSADGATTRDVTPGVDSGFNVRTTTHEYGGAEYLVVGNTVYFTNFKDQALYSQDLSAPAAAPVLVTVGSEARGERFADAAPVPAPSSTSSPSPTPSPPPAAAAAAAAPVTVTRLVAVSEVHRGPGGEELSPDQVVNRVVAVDISTGAITPLASGADFYACPRVSPCGRWLAWVQWDHPNMPWDHTTLFVAPLSADGTAGAPVKIRGGSSAVQQPTWSPDGSYLYFVDDGPDGWWNLYRCRTPAAATASTPAGAGAAAGWAASADGAEALRPMEAEFGFPPWTLGRQTFQILADGSVLALFCDPAAAGTTLALLTPPAVAAAAAAGGAAAAAGGSTPGFCGTGTTPASWTLTRLDSGLTSFGSGPALRRLPGGGGGLALAAIAGAADKPSAVVALAAPSAAALAATRAGDWEVVRRSSSSTLPDGYLSIPEAVSYPTVFDGKPATAHMLYYPPVNKGFSFPPGTLPPLLVKSHGGPTSAASTGLNASIQYWTSRGFAVADVDYGGSTGYGTAYRNRLNGRWGLVDVQDCCAAAEWAVTAGRVDPQRLTISGGSAGGFTTLACLAFRKTFSAGCSLYGVADLKLLAEHTHKFESKYLDNLLGPLPEAAAVYEERSPLNHAKDFSSPAVFFQGDQDKVVPPEQAVVMHAALKSAGLPTALVMLAGEQHGFRQAVNIRTALDGELYFYGAVLGFPSSMPPDLPDIPIDNLPPKKE